MEHNTATVLANTGTLDGTSADSVFAPRGRSSMQETRREDVRAKKDDPIYLDLPEKMNAFTLQLLSRFTDTDRRIGRETFRRHKMGKSSSIVKTFPVPLPRAFSTEELLQYLANEGKAPGDELHLLMFSIARPDYQRSCQVIALGCKWAIEEGIFIPHELSSKPQDSVVHFPQIYGAAHVRHFGGTEETVWKPGIEVIAYDIPC